MLVVYITIGGRSWRTSYFVVYATDIPACVVFLYLLVSLLFGGGML